MSLWIKQYNPVSSAHLCLKHRVIGPLEKFIDAIFISDEQHQPDT